MRKVTVYAIDAQFKSKLGWLSKCRCHLGMNAHHAFLPCKTDYTWDVSDALFNDQLLSRFRSLESNEVNR